MEKLTQHFDFTSGHLGPVCRFRAYYTETEMPDAHDDLIRIYDIELVEVRTGADWTAFNGKIEIMFGADDLELVAEALDSDEARRIIDEIEADIEEHRRDRDPYGVRGAFW
jgi:hypothetical protein